MSDEDKTPLAYQFLLRMLELLEKALADGSFNAEGWNPYELGFTVFGVDPMLQQNPSLVAEIVGHELGGSGVTEGDLEAIMRGMGSRRYIDEFYKG